MAGPAATFVTTAERRRAAGAVPRDARGARDLRAFLYVTPGGCILADIDIVNYTIPKGSTRRGGVLVDYTNDPRGVLRRLGACLVE